MNLLAFSFPYILIQANLYRDSIYYLGTQQNEPKVSSYIYLLIIIWHFLINVDHIVGCGKQH